MKSLRRSIVLGTVVLVMSACLVTVDESKIDPNRALGGIDGGRPRDSGGPSTTGAENDGAGGSSGTTPCGDTTADPSHCGACGSPCAATLVCRASKCVPPSTCKELHTRAPNAPTGVHKLTIGETVLDMFCDMDTEGGGFTMVYRVSSLQKGDPYALFIGPPLNDEDPAEATPQVTQKHYVSRLLQKWNVDFIVEETRVAVFDPRGVAPKEIIFEAKGSTRESWFAKEKVKKSPWTDIHLATFFSAVGHADEQRRFYIHKPYSTCDEDEGWLLIHGSSDREGVCLYERPNATIRPFFAPDATAQRWSVRAPELSSFAIFAR